MSGYKTFQIAGIEFLDSTLNDFSDFICLSSSKENTLGSIHLVPAGSIYFASVDPEYFNLLRQATCLPDGKSISITSFMLGQKLSQIRGTDLFKAVLSSGRTYNLKHFLLGTTNENLLRIKETAHSKYPGVVIVGEISPPYRSLRDEEIKEYCSQIILSDANVVWVGLGSPMQDKVAHKISLLTGKTVIAVGAAFDFFTGAQTEAPKFLQKLGLEWFYRLCKNPSRLWKRYLFGNLVFMYQVLLWKLFPVRQEMHLKNKFTSQTSR